MKHLVALAAILLACAACGADTATVVSSVPPGSQGSSVPATTEPAPGSSAPAPGSSEQPPPANPVEVQTWFTRGESLWYSKSLVEKRPGIGTEAVNALVAGPRQVLRAGGVSTTVPGGTRLLGLNIAGGIATVDMSSEFAAGGGVLSERMRLAQLVYTLTQFPSVKGVRLRLDGKDTTVFSGDGIVLPDPMRRSSFADLLPAIVVETPGIGDLVAGPIVVKGTANVFEANVSVEIVSGNGKVLARTFTTATCGTGCRGRYQVTLDYTPKRLQDVTLLVHDDDAAGTGTPPHQVAIPIILKP
jgi:germination protein M